MYRRTPTHFPKKHQERTTLCWEVMELNRLLWALLLFMTVFLGKKIYPEKILSVGEGVMSVLSSSIDASEAFSRLGASMDTPDEMLQGLENFCVEVFGSQKDTYPENITLPVPILPEISAGLLSNNNSVQSIRYQSIAVSQAPQPDHEPPSVGTVLTVAPLQKQAQAPYVSKTSS